MGVARGRPSARACDLLDLVPRFLQGDAQRLQRQGGEAVSLGEQAASEMLGTVRNRAEPLAWYARTTTRLARSVNRMNMSWAGSVSWPT